MDAEKRPRTPELSWLQAWRTTLLAVMLGHAACAAGCQDDSLLDGVNPQPPDIDAGSSRACGYEPRPFGARQRQIRSAGRTRTFMTYVPTTLDPSRPAPLVLVFHGAAMTAASMRDLTGFEQLAEEKGFVAVFPDGDPSLTWNIRPADTQVCGIGELFTNPEAADFQFVDDMIAEVARSQCIDRDHIFATGFSMGAYFSHHLACQRPDLVRAVAPHSGGSYPSACKGRVPTLMIHGGGDLVIGSACRDQSRALWVERNGCSAQVEREPVTGGHCERHLGCPDDGQVTSCLLDDMCHGWAGRGTGALLCLWDSGAGPAYADATTLIWRFFEENW